MPSPISPCWCSSPNTWRFASRLERYEKGEVKVNAVRQMLDRMNPEIESLRKILGAHEDKMSDAGLMVETHREILDRQFWAAVPESGKRTVLFPTKRGAFRRATCSLTSAS